MSNIKNFPFSTPRPQQVQVLKEIESAFTSDYSTIVLELPAGGTYVDKNIELKIPVNEVKIAATSSEFYNVRGRRPPNLLTTVTQA